MATSNNDRISSRRLLDTLKGLQASRHLGSEPEVVTETETVTTEVKTQYPAEGQYTRNEMMEALQSQLPNVADVESVTFWDLGDDGDSFVIPDYVETENFVRVDKVGSLLLGEETVSALVESKYTTTESYNGYGVALIDDKCYGVLAGNGVITKMNQSSAFNMWAYLAVEEVEAEVTTTTKTKHPIKQDYVPNADWTQNDPDGEGYVQGRTHWVERTTGDIPVTNESNMSFIGEMTKPEGFKAGTTTWKPEYEAVPFEVTDSGMTFTGYILAEDENGNQVEDVSGMFDSSETFFTGVAIVDYSAFSPGFYIVSCRYNNQDAQAEYILGVTEVVHKLPKMYYEQINEDALKNEIYSEIYKNFVYKTIDFNTYTVYGVDRVDELEQHLEADGFTVTRSNIHYDLRTWTKTVNSDVYTFVIRPANLEDYDLVAYKSNKGYSWECLYTNIIFKGRSTAIIPEEELKDGYMIFQLNEADGIFEPVTLLFGHDNSVGTVGYGTNPVIGTLNYTFVVSITDNASLWFVVSPHRPCNHALKMAYVNQSGKVTRIINTESQYLSQNLDAHTKVSELICGNAVIKRSVSIEPGGAVDIPLGLNEERTFNKDRWIDTANYFNYLDLAIFDEIIDQRFSESFEETYSNGETHTCTFDWWIDSGYNIHIKNTTAATTTIIPKHFTISHQWFTNYPSITLYNNGSYVSDLIY